MKKIILVILIILVITVFTVVLYNKNNPRVTFEATIEEIIEYNGMVYTSYPPQISNVLKVELLEK